MKRNKKALTIIIAVFLGITLFFTFFSKTFYNSNLPTVTATFSGRGNIENKIAGISEINYKDTWGIYGEKDGRVKKILVSVGDKVKAGETLMEMKADSEEKIYEVKAPRDGIILAIRIEEGMYVSAMSNTIIVEMAQISDVWETNLKIDAEKVTSINKDSQVTVNVKDFSEPLQGKIESINPYKEESGEEGYVVKIRVKCKEQIEGKQAEVTIQNVSGDYDSILPAYALRKDSKGYYVLALQEKESVLGNGYVATRFSVDLLDSDEKFVAVMGVDDSMPIIVSSTEEVNDGDRVMYKESGE